MQLNKAGQPEGEAGPRRPSSLIGSLGSLLGADWFSNIQRAQLKRYRAGSGGPGEIVALKALAQSGVPIETMGLNELARWMWLVHLMAHLSAPNRDPHSTRSEARPGRLLYRAGYNELDLRRLIEARGERFHALLERAVLRAARLNQPMNWAKIAPLILSHDPDNAWADRTRIEIARDFAVESVRAAGTQHPAGTVPATFAESLDD